MRDVIYAGFYKKKYTKLFKKVQRGKLFFYVETVLVLTKACSCDSLPIIAPHQVIFIRKQVRTQLVFYNLVCTEFQKMGTNIFSCVLIGLDRIIEPVKLII